MTDRKSISKAMRARVILAYHGRCAKCCKRFEAGERIDIDHIHQRATGGADDETNYRPLHYACHKIKTKADATARAKIRRLNGTTKKRPGKPIRSRGFNKSITRKFDGTVVPRVAG